MKAMYQLDAVLVDLDGTLFDSEILHHKVWQNLATSLGIAINNENYEAHFIGCSLEQCFLKFELLAQQAGKNVKTVDLLQQFREIEAATYAKGIAFKPGAESLLQYIKNEGKPLGLVTSATPEKINLMFGNTDYLDFFDLVISSQDVNHKKPHPEPYLKACQALGVQPHHTLVLEDSDIGATSACTAGCCCVMVPELTTTLNQTLKSRVAFITPSLYDVITLLKSQESMAFR